VISGLKLLIADDSATIQKVVELTFVDEGMTVASVGDGDQAISKLEEFAPDVVLADVVMPGLTGYELCEAIKHSERFNHIPVMLLVGSFEPFDEAEARRVGADDVLTKPFQSIRQLVNRVGSLLGGSGSENEANPQRLSTLGLDQGPAAGTGDADSIAEAYEDERPPEGADHLMNTDELELTTADTKPLEEREEEVEREAEPVAFAGDELMPNPIGEPVVDMAEPLLTDRGENDWAESLSFQPASVATAYETEMPYLVAPMQQTTPPPRAADEFDDVLLDLGDFRSASGPAADADSILDLEEALPVAASHMDASQPELASAGAGVAPAPFQQSYESEFDSDWSDRSTLSDAEKYASLDAEPGAGEQPAAAEWEIVPSLITVDAQLDESEVMPDSPQSSMEPQGEAAAAFVEEPSSASEASSSDRLSASDLEAIARRVVELMSDNVVREIAWEVVPELAELMIKRRLEEEK
jgi:CheY-like chemotaxis protein